jgi:drug/metabolite transporter (DMT)-like permease
MEATGGHSRGWLWAAFIALYIAWGSTYLAIRVAIETLPPLLMAGARFLTAGALLYTFMRATGTPRPSRAHWFSASVIGAFLLLGGNGGVVWAEKTVPSGVTALLVGATPFWMVVINWLVFRAARPTLRTTIGLLLGFVGLYVLVAPGSASSERIDPLGAVLITAATISWTLGSLYSKRATLPGSPILASGMQMLTGGVMLFAAGMIHGELRTMDLAGVSLRSWVALAYLAIVGSLVGFSAYVYVLKHATPAKASTYAYVNPVVAVIMGWAVAGEPIGLRTLAAGAGIVAAVVLITTAGSKAPARPGAESNVCDADKVAA